MTRDEFLALVLRDAQPGDRIMVHEETCRSITSRTDRRCDCEPMMLTTGAVA